ncbi:hypothetical protein NEHOM01_2442 [Nematocida homosporus]|uniref:uncharacterized protein n=1 Tax=Nematocida homosporus TaxID=1912981 RepID=UPI002220916D|nr:uncharacterized protein NEHOM01_2442 [Nematocida homosporus]KAI5187913.1 hypothetical protein NEHOM01_2442 [Nematocida homosporus]
MISTKQVRTNNDLMLCRLNKKIAVFKLVKKQSAVYAIFCFLMIAYLLPRVVGSESAKPRSHRHSMQPLELVSVGDHGGLVQESNHTFQEKLKNTCELLGQKYFPVFMLTLICILFMCTLFLLFQHPLSIQEISILADSSARARELCKSQYYQTTLPGACNANRSAVVYTGVGHPNGTEYNYCSTLVYELPALTKHNAMSILDHLVELLKISPEPQNDLDNEGSIIPNEEYVPYRNYMRKINLYFNPTSEAIRDFNDYLDTFFLDYLSRDPEYFERFRSAYK